MQDFETETLTKLDHILSVVQELRQRQIEMDERQKGISQRSREHQEGSFANMDTRERTGH